MCKYSQHKSRQESELDAMPMFFAYSRELLQEQMETKGITSVDEIISIGAGGYIKKDDLNSLVEMVKRHVNEDTEAKKDPEFAYQMFLYELGNHEYCITYDLTDTLDACGVTEEELENDPVLSEAMTRARKDYLANANW